MLSRTRYCTDPTLRAKLWRLLKEPPLVGKLQAGEVAPWDLLMANVYKTSTAIGIP